MVLFPFYRWENRDMDTLTFPSYTARTWESWGLAGTWSDLLFDFKCQTFEYRLSLSQSIFCLESSCHFRMECSLQWGPDMMWDGCCHRSLFWFILICIGKTFFCVIFSSHFYWLYLIFPWEVRSVKLHHWHWEGRRVTHAVLSQRPNSTRLNYFNTQQDYRHKNDAQNKGCCLRGKRIRNKTENTSQKSCSLGFQECFPYILQNQTYIQPHLK